MTIDPTASGGAESPAFGLPAVQDGGLDRPIRVFDADPDLLTNVDPACTRLLRDRGIADSVVLEEGPWTPPAAAELGPGSVGLLVLDGLLSRTVHFDGLESPELVGAGDLLRPWQDDAAIGSLAFDTEWRVLERGAIALLDERFARQMCRFPGITAGLLDRALARTRWVSFHLAIAHVRRAEPRVLMLLWHLADRWGRVTPQGVVVPLRLTHSAIARLVCMRRPTVSAALARLVGTGELARNADATWTLTGVPPDLATITRRRRSSTELVAA
jgi:CRP/FNR family cyclic AMP-dependent transcriptional regulator